MHDIVLMWKKNRNENESARKKAWLERDKVNDIWIHLIFQKKIEFENS